MIDKQWQSWIAITGLWACQSNSIKVSWAAHLDWTWLHHQYNLFVFLPTKRWKLATLRKCSGCWNCQKSMFHHFTIEGDNVFCTSCGCPDCPTLLDTSQSNQVVAFRKHHLQKSSNKNLQESSKINLQKSVRFASGYSSLSMAHDALAEGHPCHCQECHAWSLPWPYHCDAGSGPQPMGSWMVGLRVAAMTVSLLIIMNYDDLWWS